MGNCQAAEAATVIIQHPGGKVERLYWPTSAADVMRTNPGHYVALVILSISDKDNKKQQLESCPESGGGAKVTRVKLLKPKDVLMLGQVYRLITSQEVTKALQARKCEKMKKLQNDLGSEKQEQQEKYRNHHQDKHYANQRRHTDAHNTDQVVKQDKDHKRRSSGGSGASTQPVNRGRHWRPSLNSISEAMN